jgi:hypothetical protein
MKIISFLAVLQLLCSQAVAQSVEGKSDYNLFNPTPKEKMRDFVTDRPDKTEAAYTVDAGHFQHETDILNFVQDSTEGSTSSSLLAMAPNLKVGLTNSTDLQIVAQSFVYSHSSNPSQKVSGYGDTLVRLKQNIWGNDEGKTALAVMPYLKFPTNRKDLGNDNLEGGVIIPFAWDACEGLGIGAMTQFDLLRKDDDSGNYAQFINSITFGKDFTDTIGGYAEVWSAASSEAGHQVTLDFGVTYAAWEDTQFDIGINVGSTQTADDLNPFLGLSQRF